MSFTHPLAWFSRSRLSPPQCWVFVNVTFFFFRGSSVGILWLICHPHPHPHPSLFLLCLCFAPPYHSSVFVSLYINSVIVTSGMCINCDLPYLCLPPPPLSLAPPSSHSSLPASSPLHLKTPPSRLLSPPTLTFNPRMASITRTCWCVRVPWEWPPVLLPLWEASRAPLARPRLLFLSFFFPSPWLGWTRVCGRRLQKEDESVLRCVLCLLWWMNTSLGCVRRYYELSCGVKSKYLLPPKGAWAEMENSATKYIQSWIISKREYVRIYLLLFEISLQSLYPANWLSTIFLINYIPHCESECLPSFPLENIKMYFWKSEAFPLTRASVWNLQSAVMDYTWINIERSSTGGIREHEY